MTEHYISLFSRDLEKLKEELQSYQNTESIWKVAPGINNCAGNLALHLIGNINHFIGAILGNTGFKRDRDAEFNDKHVPLDQILNGIDETIDTVSKTMNKLTNQQLESDYPVEVFGKPMKTSYFILHLYGHLNYHLGQVNYHRRLLS